MRITNSPAVVFTKSRYLTEQELREVKKTFQIFDQDNSGSITTQELDNILKSLGQYLEKQELDQLVESIDTDKNGFIDFDEFLSIVTQQFKIRYAQIWFRMGFRKILENRTEALFIETFKVLDFDNDGMIKQQELEKALKYLNTNLGSDQIKQIIDYACGEEEGITLNTFLRMMLRKF